MVSAIMKSLRNIGSVLFVIFITLAMIELILRIFDPWGFVYFDDLAKISDAFVSDDERIYYLPDGTYEFSHWQATVSDQLRVTPNTNLDAECRIVLLGDSVTFGYGVDDEETWVNILAEQYPDVYLMNTGVVTYPIEPIVGTYNVFEDEGDGFLYLIISNDAHDAADTRTENLNNPAENLPRTLLYGGYYLIRLGLIDTPETSNDSDEADIQNQRFLQHIETLSEEDNMVFMAFDEENITNLALDAGYNINVLPAYPAEHRISFLDVHLDATGNEVLAESIAPILDRLIAESCE